MLLSEIHGWYWAITWDNPRPANSSAMLAGLKRIGRVTRLAAKTTVLLAPKANVGWRQIRGVLVTNLHPQKGNVVYVNLRTKRAFQWGSNTGFKWKRVG